MKQKFLQLGIGILLITSGVNAQKITLNVTKGTKLSVNGTTEMKTTFSAMGQNMENSTTMANTSNVEVTNQSASEVEMALTTTKVKLNASTMGQELTYDSDKKDNDEAMSSTVGAFVNKTYVFTTDANGKVLKVTNPKDYNEEAAGGLTMMIGSNNALTPSSPGVYIASLINQEAKVGLMWSDSTEVKGDKPSKIVNHYNITKIENGIITIENNGTQVSSGTMQQMGMEMQMSSNNKIKETIKVNSKTGLITERDSQTDILTNIDAGGMSIPVTGTTKTKTAVSTN